MTDSINILSLEYCITKAAETRAAFADMAADCGCEHTAASIVRTGEALAAVYERQVQVLRGKW